MMNDGSELRNIYNRLSLIDSRLLEIMGITSANEQHLRTLNGTIQRHEKMFKFYDDRIESNIRSISMARGAIALLGILSIIVTIVIGAKTLGL